jgi:hypothetical protein
MSEYLQNEGRLAQVRLQIKEARLRLENLRDSLRRELDQFEPLENLKGIAIQTLAFDFAARQIDYQELLDTEKALCQALGK